MDYFFSFLYLISLLTAAGIIGFQTPRALRLLMLPLWFFLYLSCYTVFFGVLSIAGVGFSLPLSVLANILIAASFLILGKKYKATLETFVAVQGKDNRKMNRLLVGLYSFCLLIGILCFIGQYGLYFNLNYQSTDPATHFWAIEQLASGGLATKQYGSYLLGAIFIKFLGPAAQIANTYICFIVSETFYFIFSGLLFISIMMLCNIKLCNIKSPLYLQVLVFLAYFLGYPLLTSLFGFSYLGVGVSAVGCLVFIFLLFNKSIFDTLSIIMLNLIMCLLLCTYCLFVPPLFLAVLIGIFRKVKKEVLASIKKKQKQNQKQMYKIYAKKTLLLFIKVFALPLLFGLIIVFIPLFGMGSQTAQGFQTALATEGFSYHELFLDFLFIAPFVLYTLISYGRNQKDEWQIDFLISSFYLFLGFAALLFIMGLLGHVSSYYFYKCYNVLWLYGFCLGYIGLSLLYKTQRHFLIAYLLMVCFIFIFGFSNLDTKLYSKRQTFNAQPRAKALFPLYNYNLSLLGHSPISETEKQNLFVIAEQRRENPRIAFLSGGLQEKWEWALGNTPDYFRWFSAGSDDELLGRLSEYDFIYIYLKDEGQKTKSGLSLTDFTDKVAKAFPEKIHYLELDRQ